ncbi:hypothetical protein D9758_013869 [Tetrapyrgos nigripes]|uniref:Uncharacterized protein n=1 Tax=Tetrapyrgos nigripes TaxID=182062 RepID=A0A8H5FR36_9AGAR|nr:hypothetical protein D9758_013869 [Tetrapyrgos nigripes]
MANLTCEDLPNPLTPLAWLDPNIANHVEISRYASAITIGGFVWDIAVNIDSDYVLLFKKRIKHPTIIYYLSRIFTLGYILTNFTLQAGNIPNCQALMSAQGAFLALSQATTSLLFLFRVQAVYRHKKLVMVFFYLLWLTNLTFSILFPVHLRANHIRPTRACINSGVTSFSEGFIASIIAYDSAVFIAVTYQILRSSVYEVGKRAQLRAFFGFEQLPAVSRALLSGGQHYYFITICCNIVNLVLKPALHTTSPVFPGKVTVPVMAISNAMACIVFRKIKLGLISDDGSVLGPIITSEQITGQQNSIPLQFSTGRRVSEPDDSVDRFTFSGNGATGPQNPLTIEVQIVEERDVSDMSDMSIKKAASNSDM